MIIDFFTKNRELIFQWLQAAILIMIPLQIMFAISTYIQAQPHQWGLFILIMTLSNCGLCVTLYNSNKNFYQLEKIAARQLQLLKVKRIYND